MGTLGRMPAAATEPYPWERRLGATPLDDDAVEFRVWALGADLSLIHISEPTRPY